VGGVGLTRDLGGHNEAATLVRHRWSRATWFAVFTYAVGSPGLEPMVRVLPTGSSVRGLILCIIPLAGILSLLQLPRTRLVRINLLTAVLAVLVAVQVVSASQNLGTGYVVHVLPALALLALAIAAGSDVDGLSRYDVRYAMAGLAMPMFVLLLLGWIVQFGKLVPSLYPSAFRLSIHGQRLQGLAVHPDSLGLLAAMITVMAFVAQPERVVWCARGIGILTVFASDSRTGIIVMGVGLFALWVFDPGRNLAKRTIALFSLAIAGAATWGVIDVQRTGNGGVLTGRSAVWHTLVPYLHNLPLFGYGPEFVPRFTDSIFGPYSTISDAQNQWLSEALNFGFASAVALTALLVIMTLRGPSGYRRLVILPLIFMLVVECFSEVPFDLWSSIVGAFPLFVVLLLAPWKTSNRARGALARSTISKRVGVEGGRTISGMVRES
jgi:hypothetical protein